MTQEVQVNVTLFLEIDAKDNKNNIKDFIDDLFYPSLNIIKHEIHSIKEEAEIYGNE